MDKKTRAAFERMADKLDAVPDSQEKRAKSAMCLIAYILHKMADGTAKPEEIDALFKANDFLVPKVEIKDGVVYCYPSAALLAAAKDEDVRKLMQKASKLADGKAQEG